MKPHCLSVALLCFAAWPTTVQSQPNTDTNTNTLLRTLPLVSDLPSGYRPIGPLNGRGTFYALGDARHRVDDGDMHHGLPATVAWAANPKDEQARTQGLHYGVENGRIVSAGYIIRQADLVAGKSFYGLPLRELDFPAAHALTVEPLEGDAAEPGQYLWLWHFLPQSDRARPMLRSGELQQVTRLSPAFTIVRNEAYVEDFYPRMGRHRRDASTPRNRMPAATENDSVWYGEAAGKLIFIEYIFSQQDFASGASWLFLPLDGVPIPPIDNVHLLHYNGARPDAGLYTAHMYFLPEERYLSWDVEPTILEP